MQNLIQEIAEHLTSIERKIERTHSEVEELQICASPVVEHHDTRPPQSAEQQLPQQSFIVTPLDEFFKMSFRGQNDRERGSQ